MVSWTCVQCAKKGDIWFGIILCGVVWTEGTAHRAVGSEPARRGTLEVSQLTVMVVHHKNTTSQIQIYDSINQKSSQYIILSKQ